VERGVTNWIIYARQPYHVHLSCVSLFTRAVIRLLFSRYYRVSVRGGVSSCCGSSFASEIGKALRKILSYENKYNWMKRLRKKTCALSRTQHMARRRLAGLIQVASRGPFPQTATRASDQLTIADAWGTFTLGNSIFLAGKI
jgi:hypothetical protein